MDISKKHRVSLFNLLRKNVLKLTKLGYLHPSPDVRLEEENVI